MQGGARKGGWGRDREISNGRRIKYEEEYSRQRKGIKAERAAKNLVAPPLTCWRVPALRQLLILNQSKLKLTPPFLFCLSLVLRDEFRLEPQNTRVAQGEVALMECGAPRGSPEPQISWRKNGQTLNLSGGSGGGGANKRIRIVDGGNLAIQDARQSDDGRYQCVVKNIVGIRESATAFLKVHGKLLIKRRKAGTSRLLYISLSLFLSLCSASLSHTRAAESDSCRGQLRCLSVSHWGRSSAGCALASHRLRWQYASP